MNWPDLPAADPRKGKKTNLNKKARVFFEKMGWVVALVENYNPYSNRKGDLWGFGDLLMFIPGGEDIVVVQVCGMGDRTKRVRKILENRYAYWWVAGSRRRHLWVHAWRKLKVVDQDVLGRESERVVWEPHTTIIEEREFEPCLLSHYPDVRLPSAREEQMGEEECVESIREITTGSTGNRRLRSGLRLVTGGIGHGNGEQLERGT